MSEDWQSMFDKHQLSDEFATRGFKIPDAHF